MNLQVLKNNLITEDSLEQIIQFIKSNKVELENYFISLTDDEIEENKFDLQSVCLGFINSSIFKLNRANIELIELITLFAQLFEKIGFYGAISVVKNNLPERSSIRHRLNAVKKYSVIGNLNDYIEIFESVLDSLNYAQDFSDVDYSGQVIQDITNYYLRGKIAFENAGFDNQLSIFKTLFNSSESRQKYKFLNHPILKEYFDGYIREKIFIELIAEKVYLPSLNTQTIFQKIIIDQVDIAGYLLKYKNGEIRADILNYGRTDFSLPYEDLSPYDKVQLYCYFNMRKHFFTTYAVYEKIYTSLSNNIFQKERNFTFIDFGCGSLTSGLALGCLFYDNEKKPFTMRYIGIDIAESMLKKAKEFAETSIFSRESEFYYYTNWNLIQDELIEQIIHGHPFIVFNASYLFASDSLNENNLADFVNKLTSKLNNSAYFVFQNPDRADRNEKYKNFKQKLSHNVFTSDTQRIYYKNNANSSYEPSNEIVNFEILSL